METPPGSYLLTYLDTSPPSWEAAIGTTWELPPTPKSFNGNKNFVNILNAVLDEHAPQDDDLKAEAKAFASPDGSSLGSTASGGAGGASYVVSIILILFIAHILRDYTMRELCFTHLKSHLPSILAG